MILQLRKNRFFKVTAPTIAMVMLAQLFYPAISFALTGGPSQPEVESFEPVGTTEMVDVFSGDFTYNVPLLDVGGYPINLSYHGNPSMDQEASWVGLGWNVNPGAITRNMRGLPDDFSGDETTGEDMIEKSFHMNPNWTVGLSLGVGFEGFGLDFLSAGFSLGVKYNSYVGVGFEQGVNVGVTAGKGANSGNTASLGLSLNSSAASGATVSPTVSFSANVSESGKSETNLGLSIGMPFNSRGGLQSMTLNANLSSTDKRKYLKARSAGKSHNQAKSAATGKSIGNSSSISFASPTFSPGAEMSMNNFGITGKVNLGGTVFAADITVDIMAYYSQQDILNNELSNPGFGYLYSQNGQDNLDALHDFNRENDRPYIAESTPNLPITNYTYDLFSVAGQGVGGQYRPYRSDVGHVYDAKSVTLNNSGAFGVEVSGGNTFHGGGDINYTNVTGHSRKWQSQNNVDDRLRFESASTGDDFEPAYFKQVGERAVESDGGAFFDDMHGDEVVDVEIISNAPFIHGTTGKFRIGQNGSSTESIASDGIERDERAKRNQAISYLTVDEAKNYGLQKDLYAASGSYINDSVPGHHIAEITVLRPDGARYVYGLPAYNKEQKEVTFNVSGNTHSEITGLVEYVPGSHNSTSNPRGRDGFYSKKTTPTYAHSYMLTAIIGPDYVDADNLQGPSSGDLGSYTLFTYNKQAENYGWRTPYPKDKANYNTGIRPLDQDDKGNYVYGRKQIYYLDKVQTRTHIAKFNLNDEQTHVRLDSKGVPNENGGATGGASLRRLEGIDLYARTDYEENGTAAEKIKSVHFEYDYSLCPGVDNNSDLTNSGKLTLTKMYFTYGASYKGEFSPYKFQYDGANPAYHIKGYDRWGNFMPDDFMSAHAGFNPDGIANAEYPYVDQNQADSYADAWCLTGVTLPSGGQVEVDYEADDYAYVQDKRAGQMFKIYGIADCGTTVPSVASTQSDLFDSDGTPNLYLFFAVAPGVTTDQQVLNTYFNNEILENLYFRASVHLKDGSKDPAYISGYAQIDRTAQGVPMVGLVSSGYGYIKLQGVRTDGDGVTCDDCDDGCANPIARAAWQYGRMHTPRLVTGLGEYSGDMDAIINEMVGSSWISTLPELWNGPNGTLQGKGYGKKLVLNESWIRLQNPNGQKKGGGSRVAKVTVSDKWDSMTDAGDANVYGQEYDYTMQVGSETWSTGVASWEPMLGGDENPHHQPIAFSQEHLLVPDDQHYQETPFGESFFPSPSVGYSMVTVKNITPVGFNFSHHGSGKVVHEFYTARDFPTKTKRTRVQPLRHKTNPIFQLFTMLSMDFVTVSQGYQVELNDMHGKQKSMSVYAEGAEMPRSKVEYFYHRNGDELDNEVTVIDKNEYDTDKRVHTKEVGLEIDMVADFRESRSQTISAGIAINTAGFLVGVFPGVVPTFWPSFGMEQTSFRSAVMTKVVNRFGILEKTVATEDGSTVQTEDLAYDSETGEVLLKKTVNAYEDPLYTFTYPAHWGYDGMGPAYQNIGYTVNISTNNEGLIALQSGADDLLIAGDEVALASGSRAWVALHRDPVSPFTESLRLIDANGNAIEDYGDPTEEPITVLRSGHRNMQTLPMGALTTTKNPISNGLDIDIEPSGEMGENVLAASAIEYAQNWQTECTKCVELREIEGGLTVLGNGDQPGQTTVNPYRRGLRGNWRSLKSHAYLSDRRQDVAPFFGTDQRTDIRKDGTLVTYLQTGTYDQTTFQPFWIDPQGTGDWTTDDTYWQYTAKVTKVDRLGQEVENVDPLDRYSAALFGYGESLPVAVASNARYTDIMSEGFEDHLYDDQSSEKACLNPHLPLAGEISDKESHSGFYSMLIPGGDAEETLAPITSAPCQPSADVVPFVIESCDCIGRFAPTTHETSTKWVASVWVKEMVSGNDYVTSYDNDIDFALGNGTVINSSQTVTKRGPIIDGWQQITKEYEFYYYDGAPEDLQIKLKAGAADTYFDDLRIQPFNSSMKAYVYHPTNLRLMTELDENNYATFYEYDEQGRLTRIKKETTRGIVTLQESRDGTKKGS